MYGWLWRQLPGSSISVRIAQCLLLLGGLSALLFVVFPAVEPHLPFGNVTVRH